MDEKLVAQLEDCLAALETGSTLDECLRRYPAEAGELRPLLQMAMALRSLRPADPPPLVRAASRAGLLAEAERRWVVSNRQRTARRPPPGQSWLPWPRLAFALVALVVALSVVAVIASRSLPGDPLYGLKRSVEDTELALAQSQGWSEMEEAYNARRIEEIQALVAAHRVAEVEFRGQVAFIQPGGWTVGPIYVYGDANTQVLGSPGLGDLVAVRAVTRPDGTLLARQIVRVR